MVLIISFSLIGSTVLPAIPNSSGQEDTQIPPWIRDVAGWWANDEISENEFLNALGYLINHNIISIPMVPCGTSGTSSSESVPVWIKNNAKWWSEDLIEDIEFMNGIEYLIKKQIILLDNKKIVGDVPLKDVTFSSKWKVDKDDLVFVQSSFFEIYGLYGDCITSESGNLIWNTLYLGLNPNKMDMYNEVALWTDSQKAVIVYPYFTAVAYADQGFYDYYRGECDACTTTEFSSHNPKYTSSGIGHQALSILGYPSITDIDIDKNPDILGEFDKVIMLHSEYVTRTMFDAITSHPNVIYLYPNALYAEIEVDYTDETITLIRGHNYPEAQIKNGFDWEFDNTHPYEYDSKCLDMQIYKINNGWMTTCYPENLFLQNTSNNFNLLKLIKDL